MVQGFTVQVKCENRRPARHPVDIGGSAVELKPGARIAFCRKGRARLPQSRVTDERDSWVKCLVTVTLIRNLTS